VKASEQYIFGLVVAVMLAGFVVMGMGYLPQARLAPLSIGLPTLGLMLILLQRMKSQGRARALKDGPSGEAGGQGSHTEASGEDASGERVGGGARVTLATEVSIIGWIVGFTALIWLVGFTVAIPVFLFLMARGKFREGFAVSLGLALTVGAGLYIAFDVLLKVPMNCGIWP
jgi:hypothetical protein